MGVSTDAVIFYGFCWSEPTELFPEECEGEWQKAVLAKRGIVSPWEKAPQDAWDCLPYVERRKASDTWCKANRADLDTWYAQQEAVRQEFGVEVGYHCSGEYSIPYLYATGSRQRASRGYPEEVKSLDVGVDWAARLERFLAELGLTRPHDVPRWWLVSYWG